MWMKDYTRDEFGRYYNYPELHCCKCGKPKPPAAAHMGGGPTSPAPSRPAGSSIPVGSCDASVDATKNACKAYFQCFSLLPAFIESLPGVGFNIKQCTTIDAHPSVAESYFEGSSDLEPKSGTEAYAAYKRERGKAPPKLKRQNAMKKGKPWSAGITITGKISFGGEFYTGGIKAGEITVKRGIDFSVPPAIEELGCKAAASISFGIKISKAASLCYKCDDIRRCPRKAGCSDPTRLSDRIDVAITITGEVTVIAFNLIKATGAISATFTFQQILLTFDPLSAIPFLPIKIDCPQMSIEFEAKVTVPVYGIDWTFSAKLTGLTCKFNGDGCTSPKFSFSFGASSKIGEWIEGAVNDAIEWTEGAVNDIVKGVDQLYTEGVKAVKEFGKKVNEFAGRAIAKAEEWLEDMGQSVIAEGGKIVKKVEEVAKAAGREIDKCVSDVGKCGENIVKGGAKFVDDLTGCDDWG